MKYYSELLKKLFDTEDELADAEVKEEERLEKEKKEQREKSLAKRTAARKIEDASILLDKAYDELDVANQKIAMLQKTYAEKIDACVNEFKEKKEQILHDAKKNVAEAEEAKRRVLSEFNAKYGDYYLKGKEADNEIKRISKLLNHFFDTISY